MQSEANTNMTSLFNSTNRIAARRMQEPTPDEQALPNVKVASVLLSQAIKNRIAMRTADQAAYRKHARG
jgi:hypothetical protein